MIFLFHPSADIVGANMEHISKKPRRDDEFPWLRDRVNFDQLRDRIKNEIPSTSNVGDDHEIIFTLLDDSPSDFTRAIQENEILKTKLKQYTSDGVVDMKSFWEVWNDPSSSLRNELLTYENPQDAMWKLAKRYQYKLATTFMPGYARILYEYFNAKCVLDPCAGWGDRVLGAALANTVKKYVSFDPNTNLRPGHAEILSKCGANMVFNDHEVSKYSNKFEMYSLPFEVGSKKYLNDESFDFAFTSPPFFDYEMYNPDNPDYVDWIQDFYVPLFQETCRCLKIGSYFGIHIGDTSAGRISHFLMNQVCEISDFVLRRKVGLMGMVSNKIRTVYLYEKCPHKVFRRRQIRGLSNPTVALEPFVHNGKTYNVLNDCHLIGGTKQRLLATILGKLPQKEIIYAGPDIGLAQVALAYACSLWGKQATVFLNTYEYGEKQKLTLLAQALGAKIFFSSENTGRTLKATEEASRIYRDQDPDNRFLAPFGLKDKPGSFLFQSFHEALSEAVAAHQITPKRLWVVAGSAFLVSALHSVWPTTHFMIVQVGKAVWPDMLEGINHTFFVAPEKFPQNARQQPPYRTVPWYDAKVWQFVLQVGEDGDYIWSVGAADYDIVQHSIEFQEG